MKFIIAKENVTLKRMDGKLGDYFECDKHSLWKDTQVGEEVWLLSR